MKDIIVDFRTVVDIKPSDWKIPPCEKMLFVGSCFADNLGNRFIEEKFNATVNPYGVMYNPASIYHTVMRLHNDTPQENYNVAVFTLGTNHVYILNETGEIVDNCMKRPQRLFTEKELTVDECHDYLKQVIDVLRVINPEIKIILTVSPIRYRKYGYHGSQLSKAVLQLAVDKIVTDDTSIVYFPAYEIVMDELRDYRFYNEDMLHPSSQTVKYIYEKFAETFFSDDTFTFLDEWRPIKEALGHKPLHPDSEEYKVFMNKTMLKLHAISKKYHTFALNNILER